LPVRFPKLVVLDGGAMSVNDPAACSQPISGEPTAPAYSLVRSAPAFVVLAIVIGSAQNFADPDLWIHVLAGQRMVHEGHILLRDSYSYAAPGLPWHNHEWLAEIVLGASYQWLGVFGLKLVKLGCTTVTMLALAVGISRTAAPPRVQRILLLVVATGLMTQIQFRPSLFTIAMLSIVIAKLAAEVYCGPVRLWTLIPLFALWANFHAGCFAGLGALGVFALVLGFQEFLARRKITRAWNIAAVMFGCALATLLNPLGTELWATFIDSASDPLMRPIITDWAPLPTFLVYISRHSLAEPLQYVVPLLLLVGLPVSLLAAPIFDDGALATVALGFIAGAFYSNRNVGLALVALSVPLAHHLGIALEKRRRDGRIHDSAAAPSPVLITIIAALVAVAGGEFSNRLKTWDPVPRGAIAFMASHGLRGNILNDFDWGEYLIWHVTPQSKVFIDGRYQLVYPRKLRLQYLAFLYGWPGAEQVLNGYPNDFALVKPGTAADRIVAGDSHWKLIYRDPVAALYAKASAASGEPPDNMTSGIGARSFFP
jgi:hypothetical protein